MASSQLGPSDLTNSFSARLSEPSNPDSVYGALRSILTSLAGLSGGGGAVANEFVPVKFRFTPSGKNRRLWTTMKVIGSNGVTHELDPNDFVRSLNHSMPYNSAHWPMTLHLEKGYTWRIKATGVNPSLYGLHVNYGANYPHRGYTIDLDNLPPNGFLIAWGLRDD